MLADHRSVFGNEPGMSTGTIIEALCAMDESPWADIRGKALDARSLSRRLGKYDVKPKLIRNGERVFRGYESAELLDAWTRYLPEIGPGNSPDYVHIHIPPRGMKEGVTQPSPSLPQTSVTSVTPVTECLACGEPLAPVLIADGEHRHIACDAA